ncbi:hypothetical protein L249_2912 [Ophiocordyceps polyrhachis-furcata BCC 54312]|uniref:EGF-like domain-containing protein n=1 Tax=Ophiocordyceps polyrhachis-furcata BCC 54312 TaxID=1330021 RepID=A0A367LMU8_9HYPO|nr:hypothetical protein L249_2912 [Ophiocordyceps polyrhachis-furcata BCC 54312]
MSQQYNGGNMDRPMPMPGSVRRARERALAAQDALSAAPPSGLANRPPPRRPPDAKVIPTAPGPMDSPHWPLPGPPVPPGMVSRWSQSHRESPTLPIQVPQGRTLIPSDHSSYADSMASPFDSPSRRTTSSVGSIPDFPLPGSSFAFPIPPRRSALGPPPSSRRGLSSMYSNSSFVSPIPEESPRKESPRPRSHESYASSAAIPETWGTGSPLPSPGDSSDFFDDSVSDKSRDSTLEDFGDESKLFFEDTPQSKDNAVLPALTEPPTGLMPPPPPPPPPASLTPGGPFATERGSLTRRRPLTSATIPEGDSITSDAILRAYAAANLTPPTEPQPAAVDPHSSNRFSYLKRSQAPDDRSSMTSLPDLIRRATTLASMIDKGTRPGSRVGDLNAFAAAVPAPTTNYSSGNEKSTSVSMTATDSRDGDSSLSDMLAAFPPPAQTPPRNVNGSQDSLVAPDSWRSRFSYDGPPVSSRSRSPLSPQQSVKKRGRRYCGMPLWLLLLLIFLLICIIVVVIVVPVELLVVRKRGNNDLKPDQNIEDCRKFLKCLNGGTNVLSPGSCSCICVNGFTGSDCSVSDAQGCTSTNLVSENGTDRINDVTIGGALPRLIVDANQTFSVPLAGAVIVGKVNEANLSCVDQNSLVTFNGQSMAAQAVDASVSAADTNGTRLNALSGPIFPNVPTIIFIPGARATIIISTIRPTATGTTATSTTAASRTTTARATSAPVFTSRPGFTSSPGFTSRPGFTTTSSRPTVTRTSSFQTTRTFFTSVRTSTTTATSVSTKTTTTTSVSVSTLTTTTTSSVTPIPTPPADRFVVNDQVREFARVAVLFILQEENTDAAKTAQTTLEQFLSRTDTTIQQASDVDVGGRNRVNLVKFTVDFGQGPVGGENASPSSRP